MNNMVELPVYIYIVTLVVKMVCLDFVHKPMRKASPGDSKARLKQLHNWSELGRHPSTSCTVPRPEFPAFPA